MRDWTGGPWLMITDPKARDFAYKVDYFLRDLSRGMERIQQGQIPDGSGGSIGGGDTFTGTPGSVIFVGADTFLEEDNAHFFWDDGNNRLGIDTAAPSARLHILGDMSATQSAVPIVESASSGFQWMKESGSAANIFQSVDEGKDSANGGTDFILPTAGTIGLTCTLTMGTLVDPGVDTGHTLYYQLSKDSATTELRIEILQTTTVLATITVADGSIPATPTYSSVLSYTMSQAEAAGITNYADIRVRLTQSGGSGPRPRVSMLQLDVPTASGSGAGATVRIDKVSSSQTIDHTQWRNQSGSNQLSIDSEGRIVAGAAAATVLQGICTNLRLSTAVGGSDIWTFGLGVDSGTLTGQGCQIILNAFGSGNSPQLKIDNTTLGSNAGILSKFIRKNGQTGDLMEFLDFNGTTKLSFVDKDGIWNGPANLTFSGGTAGSVIFLGASGVLAQDNANFFWDDTNNRLGLGQTSPASVIDVVQANQLAGSFKSSLTSTTAGTGGAPVTVIALSQTLSDGTNSFASPSLISATQNITNGTSANALINASLTYNGSGSAVAMQFTASTSGSTALTSLTGMTGSITHSSSGALTTQIGLQGLVRATGSAGAITTMKGANTSYTVTGNTATITDLSLLHAAAGTKSGSSVITNLYGVRIDDLTHGTTSNWYINTSKWGIRANGHWVTAQVTAPTIAKNANLGGAGSAAAMTAGSTDTSGDFTLTAGAAPAIGVEATITFNVAYPAAPKMVLLTPKDANAAAIQAYVTNVTATTFDIGFAMLSVATTVYGFYFHVVE